MTHDPLCPNTHSLVVADDTPCQCDLIAKVRADTLTKCIDALGDGEEFCFDCHNGEAIRRLQALRENRP